MSSRSPGAPRIRPPWRPSKTHPAITAKARSASSRASSPSSSGRACTPAPTTRCTSSRRCIDNAADEALAGYGKTHRGHAARRRLGQRRGRRPRHPVRPASRRKGAGGRDRLHAAARRRQVRQGRGRRLQLLGRPARRRRVSVTNALAKRLEVTRLARRPGGARSAFAGGDVDRAADAAQGRRQATASSGTTVRVWPDAKYFESAELPHRRADAPAAQQGRADARRDGHAGRSRRPRTTQQPGSTRAACATT